MSRLKVAVRHKPRGKNIRMAKVVLNRQAHDIKKKYKNREGCTWFKNKQ